MKGCPRVCLYILTILVITTSLTLQALAQERTTPVRVTNQVGIDPNNNTVKAAQSGSWTMSILGIPYVAQSGNWNVGITGTPNVNVTNTPSVQVTNTPTVAISSANNVVKTPTQGSVVSGWFTNNYTLPNGGSVAWINTAVNCSGYKELRFMVRSTSASPNLKVVVYFEAGTSYVQLGEANFATPAHSLTDQANFTLGSGICAFTIPVMGERFYADIYNSTGAAVTIYKNSWVYMVN